MQKFYLFTLINADNVEEKKQQLDFALNAFNKVFNEESAILKLQQAVSS
jgi:hypothetical protein